MHCREWIEPKNYWKMFEITKKIENSSKKYFNQLSGARSTQKLLKIHNICHVVPAKRPAKMLKDWMFLIYKDIVWIYAHICEQL